MTRWAELRHSDPVVARKLRTDYLRLHREQVETLDYDPVYFLLREMAEGLGLGQAGAAEAAVLHSTWYHLGSTLVAWARVEELKGRTGEPPAWALTLPKTPSRRVFNERYLLRLNLLELAGVLEQGALSWLRGAVVPGQPEESWRGVMALAETLPGNGRYFAYKIAELAEKCVGLPLRAPDAGHQHSSGPRKGLAFLYPDLPPLGDNSVGAVEHLNAVTAELMGLAQEDDVARVETTLCAFSTMLGKGDYIGRYIDRTLEEVADPRLRRKIPGQMIEAFFAARRKLFPSEALGELAGRSGVDSRRQRIYRDTGRLLSIGEH